MFHGVNVKSEARDNKRLTSKENKGEEALHSKDDKKEMLASIDIKGEVREPERLTLHDENIAGAHPNICEAHGKYEGDGAPISNHTATSTADTAAIGADGSTSIVTIKIEMTKNAKKASQAGRCLALTKRCQKSKCAKIL